MAPARSLQRAAAIATAALLAPLAAAAPVAAQAHDGRTVLSVGHTDAMQVFMNGDALDLRVKDDTGDATRYHDPDDVLFQVLPHAEMAIPDQEDYAFLGAAGDPMWLLPLAQDHTLLWPGWNTELLAHGRFKDDEVQMTLVGVDGPGEVALWTNGNFGQPNVLFDTADGLPDTLDVTTYAHVHSTWAFMAEGAYTLTWKVSGTLADGTAVSTGEVDYRWHVGELPDEDPGPDPDPNDPDAPDASDLEGRLVLDEGHVDVMSVHRTATGLELQTKDGTRLHDPADVYRDPDSIVLHATPAAETTLGEHFADPGYDQVGAPGDHRWLLPDTQKPGVLFAGWETGSISEGSLAGDTLSLSLTGFSGPGELVMLNVDDFGGAAAAVDTAQTLPQTIPTMAHSHVHTNWYFSEPGIYRLTWQAAAEAADGTPLTSAPQDFLFVVGEWPGEDPDPDPDPNDPVLESTQTITATLDTDAGGLVISVDPTDRDVVLPAMTLNSTATRWTTEGELRPVTVTDTRSADPGWNAAAQVSAFRQADGEFSSAHLGWTPGLVSSGSSQQVTPGPTVPGLLDGGPGLATSQILAATAAGGGTGTCVLDADLRLDLPTDAESGTYTALVTFTAI